MVLEPAVRRKRRSVRTPSLLSPASFKRLLGRRLGTYSVPDGLPPIRQDAGETVASEGTLEGRRPTLQLNVEGKCPRRTIQANGGEGVEGRIERAFG